MRNQREQEKTIREESGPKQKPKQKHMAQGGIRDCGKYLHKVLKTLRKCWIATVAKQ